MSGLQTRFEESILACTRHAYESFTLALLERYEGRSAVGMGRESAAFENNIADMDQTAAVYGDNKTCIRGQHELSARAGRSTTAATHGAFLLARCLLN